MASSKEHDDYLAKLQQIQDADAARLDAFYQDRRALFEEILTKYNDLVMVQEDLTSEMNGLKLANRFLNCSIQGTELDSLKHQEVRFQVLPHCRHVFFAGCHNKGSFSFLSPYKNDQEIAPKRTLIKSHGTTPKLYELSFGMTKFPANFRAGDFSHPPASYPPITPITALQDPNRANSVASPFLAMENRAPTPFLTATGAVSWAGLERNGLPRSFRMNTITPAKRTSDGNTKRYYLVNAQNKRVDEPLPKLPQQAYDQMTSRIRDENCGLKFCNQCNFFDPETCDKTKKFRHGKVNLTPVEELVLRHKVRGLPCFWSSWCADFRCPYAHNCKYGPECQSPTRCKFTSTFHVDTVCCLFFSLCSAARHTQATD
jgi:hypothetical protein